MFNFPIVSVDSIHRTCDWCGKTANVDEEDKFWYLLTKETLNSEFCEAVCLISWLNDRL